MKTFVQIIFSLLVTSIAQASYASINSFGQGDKLSCIDQKSKKIKVAIRDEEARILKSNNITYAFFFDDRIDGKLDNQLTWLMKNEKGALSDYDNQSLVTMLTEDMNASRSLFPTPPNIGAGAGSLIAYRCKNEMKNETSGFNELTCEEIIDCNN